VSITVTRNSEGKIVGATEKDRKAYSRFQSMLHELEAGELFTIDYWHPRDPELHGWHFIVLTAVFDQQEQFEDPKAFRKWVEVGAGHCDFLPGPKGRMVAVPKSIGWEKLDDNDFSEHHEKAIEFLRSPDCTRFLWGHLSDAEQSNMIESILEECERQRQEIRARRGKTI
jgi:hypothetical protein